MLLIENDEQLAFAEDRYGLELPDEFRNKYGWEYNVGVSDAFQDMKANYPPDEYAMQYVMMRPTAADIISMRIDW